MSFPSQIESLESRQHLSSTPLPWPAAPFARQSGAVSVYVNQNGSATLENQMLNRRHWINGYNLSFDDAGPLQISTTAAVTDLAFYSHPGAPSITNKVGNHHGAILQELMVDDSKPTLYAAVQPHQARVAGVYTLQVNGPAEGFVDNVTISPKSNAGSGGSDISGTNDYDFYRFEIPRPGNWVFSVVPDNKPHADESAHLDATMNVYDEAGNPIVGSFTSPVDQHATGAAEHWTAVGLTTGSVYYLRVDGMGDSTGGYGVSCELAPGTDVSIRATTPKMNAQGTVPGSFTVTRVDNNPAPLTVHYTASGTAVNGQQYHALSGTVVIPANQLSATISLDAIPGSVVGEDRTVVLSLSPDPNYSIGPTTASGRAMIEILGTKRK